MAVELTIAEIGAITITALGFVGAGLILGAALAQVYQWIGDPDVEEMAPDEAEPSISGLVERAEAGRVPESVRGHRVELAKADRRLERLRLVKR